MPTSLRDAALTLLILIAGPTSALVADGPRDNIPAKVPPVPPQGIEVPSPDQAALKTGLEELNLRIATLRKRDDALSRTLLPDVEIFARAVRDGLEHRELFSPRDVANAKKVLDEGRRRAETLLNGEAPWTTQKGLVVRGYRSRLDQTVQPYGLLIPESHETGGKTKYRLDLWFHGRGEQSTESVFIAQRMTEVGRVAPRDTIVLHPYGRYSNAFKFAGEVDVLESLEHAQRHYRIDEDRIAVRGFSMGGAGCWQMAVHYPGRFFAANPGAGFAETPEFLRFFQKETLNPTWYEKKLWRMYDCTDCAVNLFQLPTIAYSGQLDVQKQAADIMEKALAEEGLRLTHVIGPGTKHAIHPDSLRVIEEKLECLAETGRAQLPLEIRLATFTLKYDRTHWLTLRQLGRHWEQARVTGKIAPEQNQITLTVRNVAGLRVDIPAGRSPFAPDRPVTLSMRGRGPDDSPREAQLVTGPRPGSDRSWQCELHDDGGVWRLGSPPAAAANANSLRKRHNLQGPIDDAFMDSFLVVQPTGQARHAAVAQ